MSSVAEVFCIGDEPKFGVARDVGNRLQSRDVPFGASVIEGLRTQSFKIYKEVHLDVAKVELKQPIVAAIAEDIKDAQSVVIVDYRGLTVAQDTELRKKLREAGVTYKVCKNTMMKEHLKEQSSRVWMSI